ncbi:hypothetical protein CRE_18380 [Caenorhabditis remanei]|uniref:Carboxylesterase type B domain-containing protein n=1 Tax=Caenorhabditis remanei TaxID=31234 RepID=E3NVA4_CAERE|nr:hypothetical protein CRE_18380 [Caenorhabditis remanei]
MIVQTRTRVNRLLENGVPAYQYEFTYPKHADHTDDLFFIMGVHPFEEDENEKNIGNVYRESFINFVKTGKPGNGFEMSDMKTSSYFEIYWNETSGERPNMKTDFEEGIMDYWTREMVEFDENITKFKRENHLILPSVRALPIEYSVFPFSYFLFFLAPFLGGFLVAKYCCSGNERNLYIQLDGNDYPVKS